METILISIGTELTSGQALDTNGAWIADRLTRAGLRVRRHVTLADRVEEIIGAMKAAIEDADLVVVSGGLGPTADDLTRQALAAAIGQPLEERPEAIKMIEGFFEGRGWPMSKVNRVQALCPAGCDIILNDRGTAPGVHWRGDECEVFLMPGVPYEMKAMFDKSVLPAIESQPAKQSVAIGSVVCYGMGESDLGEAIRDLMAAERNPCVGTSAQYGTIRVRVLASAGSQAEADKLLELDLLEIERRLGQVVFGRDDDTLESAVGQLLAKAGKTVATAESCTGGLLAKRLTDIPGSSKYFIHGFVTYSNEAKTKSLGVPTELVESHGAVSEEVARAMASGCRDETGADYALALTGIAGPGGGESPDKPVGLVYVGLADGDGVEVRRLLLGDRISREQVRDRSAKIAMNMLRLKLL